MVSVLALIGLLVAAAPTGAMKVTGPSSHAIRTDTWRKSLPPLEQAKADFLQDHPEYGYKGWLESHWHDEIGVRMPEGSHYLDFTGSGLYTNSQLHAATKELASHVFGNPHCTSPSSLLVDEELKEARSAVLRHFNADPDEYTVVFTRSCTEGLKIIGESFPWAAAPGWQPRRRTPAGGVNETFMAKTKGCGAFDGDEGADHSHFVYLRANHKSVLGIGTFAREHGAAISCVDEQGMEEWLESGAAASAKERLVYKKHDSHDSHNSHGKHEQHGKHDKHKDDDDDDDITYSLVAFPAKDNYEGRLYPLEWIEKVHAKSTPKHKWLVALDAAAFVPTHTLDLSRVKPDFVPLSFYKMLGLPTGVGALLLRRESAKAFHIVYFGGGSVLDATAEGVWRITMPLPEGLETGTTPFLDIINLKHGFAVLQRLGGMKAIEAHVTALRDWTWRQLSALRHSDGSPLLRVFGAHDQGPHKQSGLFQFLVLRRDGSAVSAPQVQTDASARGLHLRAGCHCNPGQCLFDLGIHPEEERARALAGDLDKPYIKVMRRDPDTGKDVAVQLPTGSVRASLGSLSTFEDVYALVAFLQETYGQ